MPQRALPLRALPRALLSPRRQQQGPGSSPWPKTHRLDPPASRRRARVSILRAAARPLGRERATLRFARAWTTLGAFYRRVQPRRRMSQLVKKTGGATSGASCRRGGTTRHRAGTERAQSGHRAGTERAHNGYRADAPEVALLMRCLRTASHTQRSDA